MNDKEKYDIPISSFLTKSLKNELDSIARDEERTISYLIRKSVESMIISKRDKESEHERDWPTCDEDMEEYNRVA